MSEATKSTSDRPVLAHIERLVAEEHKLYSQGALAEVERSRLEKLQVELDQCWDLLRSGGPDVSSGKIYSVRTCGRWKSSRIMRDDSDRP